MQVSAGQGNTQGSVRAEDCVRACWGWVTSQVDSHVGALRCCAALCCVAHHLDCIRRRLAAAACMTRWEKKPTAAPDVPCSNLINPMTKIGLAIR